MPKFDSNDLNMPGYFLPEDSQSRLKKLRDHVALLSRLAQPRTWNEQEHELKMPVAELAICLESLAEQVALVLGEVSWPAQRQSEAVEATESDVTPADSSQLYGAVNERFAFGITLDQIDALNRLIQTISAQSDVVACSRAAGLADDTLPQVGQAIYDGMEAVRAILHEVEAQKLGPRPGLGNGVGETRAVYRADYALADADDTSALALPAPAYGYTGQRPH